MGTPTRLLLPVLLLNVMLTSRPAGAWYKQVSGPTYYSVGRASGLLSGLRRSPYARRAETEPADSRESAANSVFSEPSATNSILKTMSVCIREVSPNLQSCELFQDVKGSLKCQADIFLSLDSSDCVQD